MTMIAIPERGGTRLVKATEVSTVVQVTPRTSQGWDGHVTLVGGPRIPTVDVQHVLRQMAAVTRARRRGRPRGVSS